MDDLYQEIILDHYKNPHNVGSFSDDHGVHKVDESNVGCGDEFQVALKLSVDSSIIEDIRWQGQGCAISTASMSALSDEIKGKSVEDVKKISSDNLLEFLGLDEITPAREKCLMLGLKAVHKVIIT